jgi:hypothetical protein
MFNKSKIVLIVAVTAVSFVSPVFAQSSAPEYGTGNVAPFAYAQTTSKHKQIWDFAPTVPENRAAVRQNSHRVYDQARVYDQVPASQSILVGGLSWH